MIVVAEIKLYAIRHNPTGGFIPRSTGRQGRGGSHLEPAAPENTGHSRPRFFETARAARIFLSGWAKGKVVSASNYDSFIGEYWDSVNVVPVPGRNAFDMEVVEFVVRL